MQQSLRRTARAGSVTLQQAVERGIIIDMAAIGARAKNGRIIVDEPTDLPDGEVIDLVPLDEVLVRGGDYLDDEARERLHQSLREGIAQMKAGQTIDADEALARLRHSSSSRS